MDEPIYLDYMATTPVDPKVVECMLNYLGPSGQFGNPASVTHRYGRDAACAVERAREQIAEVVGAYPQTIVFTSGATESNNLAILGAARFYQRKGRHVITLATEHKSVLDSFQQLEREGFEVTRLQPDANGLLPVNRLFEALREDTILVSVMQVNNEIGVIQDIAALGETLRGRGIVFHVDAAQSIGKISVNLRDLPVDLMSFSAHKNYGPKGIGALFVRQTPRIRLQALSFGGSHESGLRAGTLATHQIVGMGEAFALGEAVRQEEQVRLLQLRQHLWASIRHLPGVTLNGCETQRVAGNLNFSVAHVDGAELLTALSELAVSTMSACSSASASSSYVLRALGLNDELARSSIRLSLGRFTTPMQVERAIQVICDRIKALQR